MSDEIQKRIADLEAQVALLTRAAGAPTVSAAPDLAARLSHAVETLAPLKPLLDDDSINDILINNAYNVFVERAGKLQRANIDFEDDKQIFEIAEAIAAQAG